MTSPFGPMNINSFAQWHSAPEIPRSHQVVSPLTRNSPITWEETRLPNRFRLAVHVLQHQRQARIGARVRIPTESDQHS